MVHKLGLVHEDDPTYIPSSGVLDDPAQIAQLLFWQDVDVHTKTGDMADAAVCCWETARIFGRPNHSRDVSVKDLGGVMWC
jgi:hypothetical protein